MVTPQDHSVLQFTSRGQKIILLRSRGLAPHLFPDPFDRTGENILAMGSDLRSAFGFQTMHNLFISQYLGDQGNLESHYS